MYQATTPGEGCRSQHKGLVGGRGQHLPAWVTLSSWATREVACQLAKHAQSAVTNGLAPGAGARSRI